MIFNTKKILKAGLLDFFQQMSALGSYPVYLIIVIIFFLINKKEEYLILISGFIALYIIAVPMRLAFFKERPEPKQYDNIFEKINASSIPSLHAARTSFLLIFFLEYFTNELTTAILLFILSLLISYSRVYKKRHYPSDVIIGYLIGILIYNIISYNKFLIL